MKADTKIILEALVNKAQKIIDSGFDQHIKKVGLNFRMTRAENDEYVIEFGLPDEVRLDAIVLTLRMFTQNKESFSFPNIHGLLRDKELSEDFRNGVIAIRRDYFDFLNSHSDYTVKLFDGRPTRGEMLQTVLYGDLAHINDPNTVQRFQNWSRDDIRSNLLRQEFTSIILGIIILLKQLTSLCEAELYAQSA